MGFYLFDLVKGLVNYLYLPSFALNPIDIDFRRIVVVSPNGVNPGGGDTPRLVSNCCAIWAIVTGGGVRLFPNNRSNSWKNICKIKITIKLRCLKEQRIICKCKH
jgi:hypothetical protein